MDSNVPSMFIMDISGQIQQLAWLESTQQWNLIWSQPRNQCATLNSDSCGPFGRCDSRATASCECLPGFEPRSPGDWELRNYSAGCGRNIYLQCENNSHVMGNTYRFTLLSKVQLPENPIVLETRSFELCQSACVNNCSCTGYAYSSNGDNCLIWTRDLINLLQLSNDDPNARDFYLKVAASDPKSRNL